MFFLWHDFRILCCSCGNLISADLNSKCPYMDKMQPKTDCRLHSCYGSTSVPKWPQKQSQSIHFFKFPGGTCPQPPLVFYGYACLFLREMWFIDCSCMHMCTPDIHIAFFLKILATNQLLLHPLSSTSCSFLFLVDSASVCTCRLHNAMFF